MPTDLGLERLTDILELTKRSHVFVQNLADELASKKTCIMEDLCRHKGQGNWELCATYIEGVFHVGCREDLETVTGWSKQEPIAPARNLWGILTQAATAKKKEEGEQQRTQRARYQVYLEKVRKIPRSQITDEMIDRELFEKQTTALQAASVARPAFERRP